MKFEKFLNEKTKSIIEKINNKENITPDEFKSYQGVLNDFASLNKKFDKIVKSRELLNVVGEENYNILVKASMLLNFKGLPSMSNAKPLVKKPDELDLDDFM